MTSLERWPLLNLLAGHVLYLGEPAEFREIDRMELDRTEGQVRAWVEEIAVGLAPTELKARMRVFVHYRSQEPDDETGLKPWHDYVFVFDRADVLIEEVLSVAQPPGEEAIRIRRFKRQRLADCSEELRAQI